MPVYEEKLICPLAIRFTQEHVRTTFRDGHNVEATVHQIETQPGDGCTYDIILRAPFPHIEITRWTGYDDGSRAEDTHWYTFDNRRLYCLQRAAAAHWPRRVAAVVEVIYSADRSSWKRKFDTTTQGQCVSVRRSSLQDPIGTWHWQQAVQQRSAGAVMVAHLFALRAVGADDAKTCVKSLMDAPDAPEEPVSKTASTSPSQGLPGMELRDAVARLLASKQEALRVAEDGGSDSDATPSTGLSDDEAPPKAVKAKTMPPAYTEETNSAEDAEEDAAEDAEEVAEEESLLTMLKRVLGGMWKGSRGETYKFHPLTEHSWTCVRNGDGGHKKFTVTYDEESKLVWWGIEGTYFFDPSELFEAQHQVKWYGAQDGEKQKPRFWWNRLVGGRYAEPCRKGGRTVAQSGGRGGHHKGSASGDVNLQPRGSEAKTGPRSQYASRKAWGNWVAKA